MFTPIVEQLGAAGFSELVGVVVIGFVGVGLLVSELAGVVRPEVIEVAVVEVDVSRPPGVRVNVDEIVPWVEVDVSRLLGVWVEVEDVFGVAVDVPTLLRVGVEVGVVFVVVGGSIAQSLSTILKSSTRISALFPNSSLQLKTTPRYDSPTLGVKMNDRVWYSYWGVLGSMTRVSEFVIESSKSMTLTSILQSE